MRSWLPMQSACTGRGTMLMSYSYTNHRERSLLPALAAGKSPNGYRCRPFDRIHDPAQPAQFVLECPDAVSIDSALRGELAQNLAGATRPNLAGSLQGVSRRVHEF